MAFSGGLLAAAEDSIYLGLVGRLMFQPIFRLPPVCDLMVG